ncbi:MAG: hypothetical protein QM662_18330 [Gordonia sp. (in: high G+C Gram-positive bacteria)]
MKMTMKRAVAGVAVAAGVAGGSFVATPQAQAAPGDLVLTGGVNCSFGFELGKPWTRGIWHMKRWLKVTARNSDIPNVTLQEINAGKKFTPLLKKNKSLVISTDWRACFPSSIAGYTVSSNADNLANNYGYWWNLRQINATASRFAAAADATPHLAGGGNVATKAAAEQAVAEFAAEHG